MVSKFHNQILIQIGLALGIGLLLGVAILGLSPLMLLAGLSGTVFIIVVVKWPEIALLVILCLSSTIIDIYALPSISIGIGHLIVYDIVVMIPLAVILIRALVEPSFKLHYTPLNLPLLSFYGIAIISTIIAIYQNSVSFNQSLGEMRAVNGYLTFFIVTFLIRNEESLRRLLKRILLLGSLVAIAMIIQYVVGSSIKILPGRVEVLGTAGVANAGITRVLPPGQSLVMIGFITTIILLIIDTKTFPLSRLFQVSVFGFAVLLTFNRNFWVAIGLALLLLGYVIPLPNKSRLVKIFLITVLLAIVLVPGISSINYGVRNLVDSATSRFMTLLNPNTLNESSLQYRDIENIYVLPQIASHPFLGLGLGTIYRLWDPRIDPALSSFTYERRAYIHNGHLWVILKTGLIGYFFFIWLILNFLKRSFQKWRYISSPFFKAIVLSFMVSAAGILASAIVNPIFSNIYWTPVLGIMLATNEVIFNMDTDRSQASIILEP